MKIKKLLAVILTLIMLTTIFAACGEKPSTEEPAESTDEEISKTEDPEAPPVSQPPEEPQTEEKNTTQINIVAMKGPTGLGIVNLAEIDGNAEKYNVTYEATPDGVAAKVISGGTDIAAVPVNLAATLYNKTEGEVTFLAVNTLGVIHVLTKNEEVASIADLKGKTIYATGQGATPEYVLRYVLAENGLDPDTDVEIIFESEGAAVVAKMIAGEATVAVLPEPLVTAAETGDDGIKAVLDLTKEWEKVSGGAVLTTGGVIVRNEFLSANPEAVADFMAAYEKSCNIANNDPTTTATLAGELGIMDSHVAETAIPRSNIKFVAGQEMQTAVSKYLEILFNSNPKSVGGNLPDEKFYYQG